MGSDFRSSIISEWHDDGEQYVIKSGIPHLFIRPTFLFTNAFNQLSTIAETGLFYQRIGNAKVSWMDPRDFGEVAARVASHVDLSHWNGKVILMTGPELYSASDITQTFTKVLKRTVTYVDMTEQQALQGMVTFTLFLVLIEFSSKLVLLNC